MSKYDKKQGFIKPKYRYDFRQYDDLPYRKRKKAKSHSKSNHKHQYVEILDKDWNMYKAVCTICGFFKWTRFNIKIWGE